MHFSTVGAIAQYFKYTVYFYVGSDNCAIQKQI